MTVDAWLKALVGNHARAITWTGGACNFVNDLNPIDAAKWPWCAQATVLLVQPKRRDDNPMVEIYFKKPDHGRPGAAYAFRSLMMTPRQRAGLFALSQRFRGRVARSLPPGPRAADQARTLPNHDARLQAVWHHHLVRRTCAASAKPPLHKLSSQRTRRWRGESGANSSRNS